MQKELNLKVKFRESFRPFAPSITKEDLSKWFDLNCDSPYMLLVANIKEDKKIEMTENEKKLFGIDKLNVKRSEIPAVTHVDYSASIQTVTQENNKPYYDLISMFLFSIFSFLAFSFNFFVCSSEAATCSSKFLSLITSSDNVFVESICVTESTLSFSKFILYEQGTLSKPLDGRHTSAFGYKRVARFPNGSASKKKAPYFSNRDAPMPSICPNAVRLSAF